MESLECQSPRSRIFFTDGRKLLRVLEKGDKAREQCKSQEDRNRDKYDQHNSVALLILATV